MAFSSSYASLVTTLTGSSGDNAGLNLAGRAPGSTLRVTVVTSLATLTTGLNSGTAGTGTSPTSVVKQNGSANLTAHNGQGKFLKRTGGGGYVAGGDNLRPIIDNTTSAFTIAAMAGLDSTSTYEIVDLATKVDRISSGDLVALRVAGSLGPVELVGLDFSNTHALDGLIEALDSYDVLVRACKFSQNTTQAAATFKRCHRVRLEHCLLTGSSDVLTDGCDHVEVTDCLNLGGGVIEVDKAKTLLVNGFKADGAPSFTLSVKNTGYVGVECDANNGGDSAVYFENCGVVEQLGAGLTGSGNAGYGIEIAGGGSYDFVGATITGSSGDVYLPEANAAGVPNLRWSTEFGTSFGAVATATTRIVARSSPTMTMWFGPIIFMQDLQLNAGVLEYGFVHPSQLTGVTATGTTSADAYVIPQQRFVRVDTTPSGTGVRASPAAAVALPGYTFMVSNKGANALLVYPPTGGTIDGAGVDVGYSLAPGAKKSFVYVSNDCLTLESF